MVTGAQDINLTPENVDKMISHTTSLVPVICIFLTSTHVAESKTNKLNRKSPNLSDAFTVVQALKRECVFIYIQLRYCIIIKQLTTPFTPAPGEPAPLGGPCGQPHTDTRIYTYY